MLIWNLYRFLITSIDDAEVEVSKSEIRDYIKSHPEQFETEATRDIQYVHFQESASVEDESEVKAEHLEVCWRTKLNSTLLPKPNDTVAGFATTTDYETFVNENSDEKFLDRFVFKNQLASRTCRCSFQPF